MQKHPDHETPVTAGQIRALQDPRCQQDTQLDSDEQAFFRAHVAEARSTVLTSPSNPGGWRLEQLLVRLRAEVSAGNEDLRLRNDEMSRHRLHANQRICAALFDAEGMQRDMLHRMQGFAPNDSPRR